ncbi:hypothetical protein JTE90_019948 [Oedothorax gibbosus]|uniref:DEK-C domain-containing protein n=1 Tax=Oedothorax gibbosus TaxID=931172 RepID=A0AAV6UUP3_9ARAC|nr:hypothetical protein JTE90_019948 [Oedothorax gibbosus]
MSGISMIAKAVEIAEYETLQVVYQLLYQRSAWDTQQILARRILEFSGFNFSEKSEDYFNREMMLRTQPNDMLVKIGAVLGLSQIQKMLFDMDNGRADLIASIMYFLSKPNKTTHLGVKYGTAVATEPVVPENSIVPPARTISTCGCRHRCFRKFSQARQKALLEYMKTLDERKLGDKYLLTLIDCKKIIRQPNENLKKFKEVSYEYKCKYGSKQTVVCKGAFVTLHGVKQGRMNNLQLKLKKGRVPKINPEDFPPMVPLEEEKAESEPESENSKNTSISTEQQNQDSQNESPKVATPSKQNKEDHSSDGDGQSSKFSTEKFKLKELPLVVSAIESSSEELLLDVHFLLYLNSADANKVKENILEFDGFTFDCDTEDYEERIEFLQRMSSKIVTDVARAFSLGILSTKEATIKNILRFLTTPNETFLKSTTSGPLTLSDVELDDIGDMSDSDVSITCEVVEKKVECIDILSSGEDSDQEGKPHKEKKASPQKSAILKQALSTSSKSPAPSAQPQALKPIAPKPVPAPVPSTPTQSTNSNTPKVKRYLRNFETICKIVNTHPHEYLVDIHELLYLKKENPDTLRDDILNFSGFDFDKTSPEYVKRKQLLDRMLYNSVRRVYNTLIHNTTEVKVFSKPTMITEIFQFLFNLPPNDTSVRPQTSVTKSASASSIYASMTPIVKSVIPSPSMVTVTSPAAPSPSIPSGKLSDLKRVFQRVACFPCEYLTDVHKLLFMTDCDQKVIRQNIFAFKGFDFTSTSQEFQQRKMYLEYLTFHSLRKISSVLTTRSVDLRNSTKHELASHLTQVLAEYCTDRMGGESVVTEDSNSQEPQSNVTSSSAAVENIVVTPIIDPSYANPPSDMEVYKPPDYSKSTATPNISISIVDTRSVNSPSVSTTTNSNGRRKRTPAKIAIKPKETPQLYTQSLNIYSPGIATFSTPTQAFQQTVNIPILNTFPQPIQIQPAQPIIGLPQVPNTNCEMIMPVECIISEPEETPPPKKKAKLSTAKDSKSINDKIREAINSDDEDCDKPLSSLVGHPIDSVIKKHIVDIVEKSDLASITINGVIKKIFGMYPKFDLSYRKEFIKSTLRSMLYKLGEQKNASLADKRETNSPDCSVTTTENCDTAEESPASATKCS